MAHRHFELEERIISLETQLSQLRNALTQMNIIETCELPSWHFDGRPSIAVYPKLSNKKIESSVKQPKS